MPIYAHGAQDGYVPWQGVEGGQVTAEGATLAIAPQGGQVRFTQPLIDLYVKPGPVQVTRAKGGAGSVVTVSLTEPQFRYQHQGRELVGSIWDLRSWQIRRLTTKDIDNPSHGSVLNEVMGERLGDVRLGFVCQDLAGPISCLLNEGEAVAIRLDLSPEGWRLLVDGAEIAAGDDSPLGSRWVLSNCDNRVELRRDGEPVAAPVAVAAVDPEAERCRLAWAGSGSARLSAVTLDRDLHYSRRGFLADERLSYQHMVKMQRSASQERREHIATIMEEVRRARAQMIAAVVDADLRAELQAALAAAQEGRRGSNAWLQPIGDSPERALLVPDDGYLLLGDNSPFSWDGRSWAWVPGDNLRGEVLAVVWPLVKRWKIVR
ncbi:MAG: S26 family signal peptidase [Planctomycetota bacterium]